jgi:hypothetical protein
MASVLVRELNVDVIPRDAVCIVVGPRMSGSTGIAQSLLARFKFKNICVRADGSRHSYVSLLGENRVHPLTIEPAELATHTRDADCLVLEDVVRDDDVPEHVNLAHGKFCIVVVKSARNMRPDVRGRADIILVGNGLGKKDRLDVFHAWSIPDFDDTRWALSSFDDTRWALLLAAVTTTPDEPRRILVIDRSSVSVGVQLAWYRGSWLPVPPKTSSTSSKIQPHVSDAKTPLTSLSHTRFPLSEVLRPLCYYRV